MKLFLVAMAILLVVIVFVVLPVFDAVGHPVNQDVLAIGESVQSNIDTTLNGVVLVICAALFVSMVGIFIWAYMALRGQEV